MMDARNFRLEDTLRDGRSILIRAIRADDRDRLRTAFSKLHKETVYTRFFAYKTTLSEQELKNSTEVDFENDVALVVETMENAEEVTIGVGRFAAYEVQGGVRAAEIAFVVAEGYQGQGIAGRLLKHLIDIARDKGIVRFDAEVLPQNTAMLRVFEKSGLPMERWQEEGVVYVAMDLGAG